MLEDKLHFLRETPREKAAGLSRKAVAMLTQADDPQKLGATLQRDLDPTIDELAKYVEQLQASTQMGINSVTLRVLDPDFSAVGLGGKRIQIVPYPSFDSATPSLLKDEIAPAVLGVLPKAEVNDHVVLARMNRETSNTTVKPITGAAVNTQRPNEEVTYRDFKYPSTGTTLVVPVEFKLVYVTKVIDRAQLKKASDIGEVTYDRLSTNYTNNGGVYFQQYRTPSFIAELKKKN